MRGSSTCTTRTAGGGSLSTPGVELAASRSIAFASVGWLAKATCSENTMRWSGSGAEKLTMLASASALLGTTCMAAFRSRMLVVRQLMSMTWPSTSPELIQSPGWNG